MKPRCDHFVQGEDAPTPLAAASSPQPHAWQLDYLVGAFLILRLPPFRPNVKKRLTKSPRIYWRESGLLHALLNVPDQEALLA
jgi:predicted AAA+ superfamily ATPase